MVDVSVPAREIVAHDPPLVLERCQERRDALLAKGTIETMKEIIDAAPQLEQQHHFKAEQGEARDQPLFAAGPIADRGTNEQRDDRG